jgi:hypothetical protein
MSDIVERLRACDCSVHCKAGCIQEKAADEIEQLRAMVLDACEVFDHYELPQQAFHYRRAVLGLEQARKIARGANGECERHGNTSPINGNESHE